MVRQYYCGYIFLALFSIHGEKKNMECSKPGWRFMFRNLNLADDSRAAKHGFARRSRSAAPAVQMSYDIVDGAIPAPLTHQPW